MSGSRSRQIARKTTSDIFVLNSDVIKYTELLKIADSRLEELRKLNEITIEHKLPAIELKLKKFHKIAIDRKLPMLELRKMLQDLNKRLTKNK